jgi:hypothetical protein
MRDIPTEMLADFLKAQGMPNVVRQTFWHKGEIVSRGVIDLTDIYEPEMLAAFRRVAFSMGYSEVLD